PPEVIEAINQIKDISVLKQLHRQAITISSMVEFQQLLSHASG
ncbi:MAG: transposase, partial [Symploca sp. SIO2G7]|nr:transposase [Symploca sp. SIO2G7]